MSGTLLDNTHAILSTTFSARSTLHLQTTIQLLNFNAIYGNDPNPTSPIFRPLSSASIKTWRVDDSSKIRATTGGVSDNFAAALCEQHVQALFLLILEDSGDGALSTTLRRELGFAAHHAIYHLAMIKRILVKEQQVAFESTPCTAQYDKRQQ